MSTHATNKDELSSNAVVTAIRTKLNNFQNGGNCATLVPSLTIDEALVWFTHLFPNAPVVCEDRTGLLGYELERDAYRDQEDEDQGL